MDIFETILKRRSVRSYQDKEIPEADLNKILEAARMAPSGFNAQTFRIVVVRDRAAKIKLGELAKQPFIAGAPIILAAINLDLENKYSPLDVAIMFDHVMLSACALGIGSVFVGAYHNDEIRKFLGAPDDSEMIALMPLGYPADKEIPKKRKSLNELISYEKF